MKELSYRFSPQAEVRICVTETMQQDFKECQEMFRVNPDDEKDCNGCSWNCRVKGSELPMRLCMLPTVQENMKEVLAK